MTVRAKFKVDSIEPEYEGLVTIRLSPVVKMDDPENENNQYWKYTPSGQIILGVVNPAASDQFEIGKEYYVDFTSAE